MIQSPALTLDGWTVLARDFAKAKYDWVDFTSNEIRSAFRRRLTPRQFVEELAEQLSIAPIRAQPANWTSPEFDRRPQ